MRSLIALVKRVLNIRIIRYGLVGGIGIPINDVALFLFQTLFGGLSLTFSYSLLSYSFKSDLHYALSSACAFEVSTTVNFILNQLFTYHEQKLRGWQWVQRAAKAQLTSFSAILLSFIVGLILVYGLKVNEYIANPLGIVLIFIYNFFISRRFVFRPVAASEQSTDAGSPIDKNVEVQVK